jgi:hypothetical protein
MPWHCLDEEERTYLLALIRKMVRAESAASTTAPPTIRGQRAEEVSQTAISAQPLG